ncbi:MAG: two pore domain potassium channel family protein [Planctomycetia bacterium]|nr:two pore domain potassium channel family protein [Planctomycetia bacterium]
MPPTRAGLLRLSVTQFLAALVLVLVAMPFVEHFHAGDLIETVLMTVVLLAAVPAVGGQRRTLLLAVVLVTPAVTIIWVDHVRPGQLPRPLAMVAAIGFVGFVAAHLLRFILRAPQVTGEVLCAGVAVYLMLAILWAFGYLLVEQVVPRSFVFTVEPPARRPLTGFEAVYFSFGTMTTVGYGDIIPTSRLARMVAMLEATTGMFYVTLLIARLVALYSSNTVDAPSAAATPHSQETSP